MPEAIGNAVGNIILTLLWIFVIVMVVRWFIRKRAKNKQVIPKKEG